MDSQEIAIRNAIEEECRDRYKEEALQIITQQVDKEESEKSNGILKTIKSFGKGLIGSNLSPLKLLSSLHKPQQQQQRSVSPSSVLKIGEDVMNDNNNNSAADREDMEWARELERITAQIKCAGLSIVDPLGHTILPPQPPKKAQVAAYVPPELSNDMDSHDGDDGDRMGLKIRLWHRDRKTGDRANFLGLIHFTEEVRSDNYGIFF